MEGQQVEEDTIYHASHLNRYILVEFEVIITDNRDKDLVNDQGQGEAENGYDDRPVRNTVPAEDPHQHHPDMGQRLTAEDNQSETDEIVH